MRARIWGSRGSIASPGGDTERYGGNTSCIELRPPGSDVVILDAGTGIRELGVRLVAEGTERMFLLLTHLHVDHVEGLGMFEPIWRKETELHIWGPASPVASLEQRIATYFSPPLFPVHLSEVPATIEYHDASESEWQIDGAGFSSNAIIHPGPTVGYRVESEGRVLAYLTDHEPALGADLGSDPSAWISGSAIAHRADVLIHDCQYTPEEYENRLGWGHSTTEHVARFAEKAEVDRLLLFHHDPMHSDDVLDAMREDVVARWGVDDARVAVAGEGTEMVI
ncbi:MAG TPA: MBL fold metallo-hydrolase [Actinomycetota bacterium]|nr:MBL fold metallo-hydrolase [Actinomycetota bacterium]